MDERKELICWIKEHRKELAVVGISIVSLILIVLGIKNRKKLKEVWDSLQKCLKHPTTESKEAITKVTVKIPHETIREVNTATFSNSESLPFEVARHIRNLPAGWHASPEKIAEARKHNIILTNSQTWVESYMKGGAVA